jgi:hypothetical protein
VKYDGERSLPEMKRSFGRAFVAFTLVASFGLSHPVEAAAIDDIRLEVRAERCEGFDPGDKSFVVYATNVSPSQSIDARFKYDSVPAQQHFILFDASLKPITDRFPKYHARRLEPREALPIGCTSTYRAPLERTGALTVPVVITIQGAKYVDPGEPEAPSADAGSFAAFTLQGSINECGPGARPAGLLYVVNLHPFARLSASITLIGERGNQVALWL